MRDGRGAPYPHDGAPHATAPRRRPPACEVPVPTCSYTYARLYPCGWLCDRHAPWARLGLPKPEPGPGWPIHRPPGPDPTREEIPDARTDSP